MQSPVNMQDSESACSMYTNINRDDYFLRALNIVVNDDQQDATIFGLMFVCPCIVAYA